MRKHMLIVAIFPALAFIWLVGWFLFRLGSKGRRSKPVKDLAKREKGSIEILGPMYEERSMVSDD